NQYLGGDTSLSCSSETAAEIDRKVVALVRFQHEKAKKLLEEHIQVLHMLAKYLYEHETLTGDEFMSLLEEERKQRESDR
ncbi:MAG: cell division protein FtsH, partial [Clostridia bacterium]|nr:cell division protein FtsH [Clostridia bacterium]